jgi:serine/arginine repetitive matrix protein 2
MWGRFTGKSDSGSSASKDRDDESRRRRTSDSTRVKRDSNGDLRSIVSSASTRKPARRDGAPSSIASFATAFDEMPRTRAVDDMYEDPRDERYSRPSSYADSSVSAARRDRSRSRERDDKGKRKSRDDKDKKVEKRRSTRSESLSQAGGYRGDIVESPKQPTRSFSGQIGSEGFSQFPGQAGAPLMSGALPRPPMGMSSHVTDQFPGQNPAQFASSALPGGHPFGAAAEFYNDQGASVHQQPGVRPQEPSLVIGQDTPHLVAAAAYANPIADTGSGAAADFYGASTNFTPAKPPRPSTMPGAFYDDEPAPQKPPRPSSKPAKPTKPSKLGSAATLAGGSAVGYAMGHTSSNTHQSTTHQSTSYNSSNNNHSSSYTNGNSGPLPFGHSQGGHPSTSTVGGSSHIPTYSQAMVGAPPPKPPRPGKPEKHSSGSNAGLYAAGAAGLAAYGLHQHDSHSGTHNHTHTHTTSTSGAYPGQNYNNGLHSSSNHNNHVSGSMAGDMAQRHQHTGPVSRFVDWWKDYEDVQKMEEYTEYIGVCKYCFDPRSSAIDAPRKHHYGRRRSSEYMRPSGGIEKQSRYGLKEKKSHSSFSSGDERRKKHSSNAAGWVAAGLGGIGLAKAGKAVMGARRDDFDDTYSIKSGRDHQTGVSGRSRSRSRARKDVTYGRSEIRRRSHSRDRMSQMSVGVTKDKKDYKVVRKHSRSRSRSSSGSRGGRSGFGTALGVGLAGAALGAAVNNRRRSRSKSPKKVVMHHRRDSSDDERRRRRSQQLRRKASRSSTSGASVIDISQNQQSQTGFLGGFFAAPAPKLRRRTSIASSHKKKKKGFFTFGNGSASSSDSEMAFGTGFVQRKRKASPKRRNSEERLKMTLAGLGATAAAIAAAKAARSSGKHHSEVVAVKERRNSRTSRKSSDRPRPSSRLGDDEWEDLPDDDTSDSSENGGLVYGDYDWRKGKSQESLVSNGSGTNKWGWRWGFGQKKKKSSDNLYDNIAGTSFIGPATAGAAGALTGAAIGTRLGRHDSESSSVQQLQTVHPVASSNDPTSFDARRTSSTVTPQPLITSGPGVLRIQQPQPVHQVPGALYSTQSQSQYSNQSQSHSSYSTPSGPSVFSQASAQGPFQTQQQTQNIIVQAAQPSIHPPLYRRANSSPIQSSSWKRDVAIAGFAATAGAAAIAAANRPTRSPGSPSNVRFNLTKEQADKDERERHRERSRRDEEDRRRREDLRKEEEARKDEEDRRRREQQLRDDEARRVEDERRREQTRREQDAHEEEERRRRELLRQQEEARKYNDIERLAMLETARRADERRRHEDDMRARELQEAELRNLREREARDEAQRRVNLEADAEQMRKERREADQREADRLESKRRDAEIREAAEQRQIDYEAQQQANRYGSQRDAPRLEQQRAGGSVSSVATDVRRKEKELEERERDVVRPDTRKSTVASAVAAGAAAAITSAAISSYKDKEKEKKEAKEEKKRDKERERERRRDSTSSSASKTPSSTSGKTSSSISGKSRDSTSGKSRDSASAKTSEASTVKPYEPSTKAYESSDVSTVIPSRTRPHQLSDVSSVAPSRTSTYEPSDVSTVIPSKVKTIEPSSVVTYAPSNIQQDYAPEEIFDPNYFKKSTAGTSSTKKPTPKDVFQDWEERYNGPQVTQAEFFAPKELLQNDSLPKVRLVDPNEGATNLTRSEAHDAPSSSHPMAPPYPAAYAFVATRDGRPSQDESWPVPALNLIAPTPPGSRAPSVRGASGPPSPNIEPIRERKEAPKPDDANRARSRVSWGENQFHHFEVPTPDSYREQFISDGDLKKQDQTYSRDDMTVEREPPKSESNSTTYQPYRQEYAPKAPEAPQVAPSTQYIRDEKTSDWDNIVSASSKKISKSDEKKAKAAMAAAVSASGIAAMVARDEWEDKQNPNLYHNNASVISNPFSDRNAAASTIAASTVGSVAPSSIGTFVPSTYESSSDANMRNRGPVSTRGPGYVEGEVVSEPEAMHIPGSFDEPSMFERAAEKPVEEDWEAPTKASKKGKKKSKNTDDIVVTHDTPKRAEPELVSRPEPLKEEMMEAESKMSKKDKKKKSKASKRASVDSWEESDISPLASPTITRDIRDMEPSRASSSAQRDVRDMEPPRTPSSTQQSVKANDTSRSDSTTNNVAASAMAGGFAALLGTAMKQDQERISSDFEHARQSFESAEKHNSRESPISPPNGTRAYDRGDRSLDEDDLVDAKSPRRKKEKRHSSGRWSPTIGSPLRTETKYEDYIGPIGPYPKPSTFEERPLVEAPKVPTQSVLTNAPQSFAPRSVYDSGYHAPDDMPRKESAERDSDEFFSAGSEEREREREREKERETSKVQSLESARFNEPETKSSRQYEEEVRQPVGSTRYDEPETKSSRQYEENVRQPVVSPKAHRDDDTRSETTAVRYDDDLDREERHRERQEVKSESREQSRDRTYGLDDGTERKRRHRRRETEDAGDDWDTRSTISEARSDANGERRRKHKRRDGSLESTVRSRSSAASEPGDLDDERKSSRRKSRRDDDDNASVISTSSRHDDDRSSRKEKEKEKEKRSSGLFGLFSSKSRENLAEAASKSSKSKDDEEEEGKRRRRKHRSDRGSAYGGSDDDDNRSTISSSSRREKRTSRSERGEGERRESYDDKVHRSSHAR